MRVTLLPIVLAGAGLLQYATASPIRVVVVSSHQDVSTNIRWGKPVELNSVPIPIFRPIEPTEALTTEVSAGRHHLCQKLRDKALEISNKFRESFGLPLIDVKPLRTTPSAHLGSRPIPTDQLFKILPIEAPSRVDLTPAVSTPKNEEDTFADSGEREARVVEHVSIPARFGHGHGQGQRACLRNASFLHRVHRALMILGPWEGRAVAFVLGCGIGVLLRMFWVIAIVSARAIRGKNTEDDDVQHVLVFESDAEEILVAPPQYTDEKVALVLEDNDKKVDTTA